jgi:hypothetical protein
MPTVTQPRSAVALATMGSRGVGGERAWPVSQVEVKEGGAARLDAVRCVAMRGDAMRIRELAMD